MGYQEIIAIVIALASFVYVVKAMIGSMTKKDCNQCGKGSPNKPVQIDLNQKL